MKRKKRIVLVANTSWYLYNFREGVINYLLKYGFEVVCIAPADSYTEALQKLDILFIHVELDQKGTNILKDWDYYSSLRKIYKKYAPDFIFHYTIKPNIYGSIAAGILGIPCISIVSGAGAVFLEKNLLFKFVKRLYHVAGRYSNELWFVNEEDQKIFIDERIVPIEKTRVLPGEGINSQRFTRKSKYGHTDDTFTFLFSARLLWAKGIGLYVNAAKKLREEFPKARFLIIGFFDKASEHTVSKVDVELWEKEGVISYLGALEDVKPLLETIDCLVFPSYYREGVPRVLLEAASMEIPIVTTDNVGCRDVVKHNVNGLLCEPKNENDVYVSMKRMLQIDKKELIRMGENSRQIILQKFDEEYVLSFYKSALDKYLK